MAPRPDHWCRQKRKTPRPSFLFTCRCECPCQCFRLRVGARGSRPRVGAPGAIGEGPVGISHEESGASLNKWPVLFLSLPVWIFLWGKWWCYRWAPVFLPSGGGSLWASGIANSTGQAIEMIIFHFCAVLQARSLFKPQEKLCAMDL